MLFDASIKIAYKLSIAISPGETRRY
jgi:hypothetical protein